MKKSPEILIAAVIIALIILGVIAYVVGANHAVAPTTNITVSNTPATVSTSTQANPSSGTTAYADPNKLFSFSYPSAFTLSGGSTDYVQDWMVNSTADGLLLVKVVVPQSFEPKTNFGDAKFTVGTSPHPAAVSGCLAAPASGTPVQKSLVTINGVPYTRYVSSDAGAGNLYTTTSYRTVHNGQCYAIEYTIHSSNIQNYPSNSGITAFDEAKVQQALESIVQSFKFTS